MYAAIDENKNIIEYPIFSLRDRLIDVSLPETITPKNVPEGYICVSDYTPPTSRVLNYTFKCLVEGANGYWKVVWDSSPKSSNEIAEEVDLVSASISAKVNSILFTLAKQFGYDSIATMCSYSNSTVPKYAKEANLAIRARDYAWSATELLVKYIQDEFTTPALDISTSVAKLESDINLYISNLIKE